MTYEIFKETLLAELKGHFPPDTTISIHSIPKNNHVYLDGLTILESGYNIAPTIYTEQYYDQFLNGSSLSEILEQILHTYHQYRPMENIDTSFFKDFKNVKDHVVYKLIHYDRNKELLKNVPHIPYLDLAIVFYYLMISSTTGTATILIQNPHLKLWDIDTQELYTLAKSNTPALLSSSFDKLTHLLSDIMPEFNNIEDEVLWPPMYILTNENRFLGASCILYDELLLNLSSQFQCDFYIIPSSVHEVLLIPADKSMNSENFNEMIREVNDSQVSPEEILSDHVYYYNRQQNLIMA